MSSSEKPVEKIYEHGLTTKSFLDISYVAIIMQPAIIWIYFTTDNLIAT